MDWREITVEFNGRPVSGSYAVENQIVVVRTPQVKSGQAGTTNPVWIAFRLLRSSQAAWRYSPQSAARLRDGRAAQAAAHRNNAPWQNRFRCIGRDGHSICRRIS